MKAICLTVINICAFTQASLAITDEKAIVDQLNKDAGGSILAERRCGALMNFVEDDKEALDHILTIEANGLQNENAKPVQQRTIKGMNVDVSGIPAEEEILEIIGLCPAFQSKYKYMISGKSHKLFSDKTKSAHEDVQKKLQSLEDQVKILEGRVDSLTRAMKK